MTALWCYGVLGRVDGSGGEVNENLGEFWGEHADKGVASGTGLVATGVGGDVLGADGESSIFLVDEDFYVVGFFAKLVVVRGGRGEDGVGVVGDNTDGATVALEDGFEFEGLETGGPRGGFWGIVGETNGDFAWWE